MRQKQTIRRKRFVIFLLKLGGREQEKQRKNENESVRTERKRQRDRKMKERKRRGDESDRRK